MKIGLIGAGAIANFLLKEINENQRSNMRISSVYVRSREKYTSLEAEYNVKLYTDLDEFLLSNIDIVVEAANVKAVQSLLPKVIQQKDSIIISIGAIADTDFLQEITDCAQTHNHSIYLPSGAVGGLDLIQNAQALGTLEEVSLTTRKPAHTLIDQNVDEEVIVFNGNARDAIKKFPKNMNVSIVLSLAGIGIDQTKVTIIADPYVNKNIHEVKVKGDFGSATFSITNNPLPENPKTSYLAAMSILGTLKRIKGNIKLG